MIKNDPRFYRDSASFKVKIDHIAKPSTVVDDQCFANSLAALTRTSSTRQHGCTEITRDIQRAQHIGLIARHDHPSGCDLVDRGIGRVTPAACRIKQHVATNFLGEACGKC